VNISFLAEKLPHSQIYGTKLGTAYKNGFKKKTIVTFVKKKFPTYTLNAMVICILFLQENVQPGRGDKLSILTGDVFIIIGSPRQQKHHKKEKQSKNLKICLN